MTRCAVLVCALLAGCSDAGGDWLIGEARSPDGSIVARLWCEDFCDVPGRTTLTLSPADRRVATVASEVAGFPPRGAIPHTDAVLTFDTAHVATAAEPDGVETRMRWAGPRQLVLSAPCPRSGAGRALGRAVGRGVAIAFRNAVPDRACGVGNAG